MYSRCLIRLKAWALLGGKCVSDDVWYSWIAAYKDSRQTKLRDLVEYGDGADLRMRKHGLGQMFPS